MEQSCTHGSTDETIYIPPQASEGASRSASSRRKTENLTRRGRRCRGRIHIRGSVKMFSALPGPCHTSSSVMRLIEAVVKSSRTAEVERIDGVTRSSNIRASGEYSMRSLKQLRSWTPALSHSLLERPRGRELSNALSPRSSIQQHYITMLKLKCRPTVKFRKKGQENLLFLPVCDVSVSLCCEHSCSDV